MFHRICIYGKEDNANCKWGGVHTIRNQYNEVIYMFNVTKSEYKIRNKNLQHKSN